MLNLIRITKEKNTTNDYIIKKSGLDEHEISSEEIKQFILGYNMNLLETAGTSFYMKGLTLTEIESIYDMPILDLIHKAASVYRENFDSKQVQLCTLLSVKTGNCPEDCSYCAQSLHHQTELKSEKLKPVSEVFAKAKLAKENGSNTFLYGGCLEKSG